MNIYDFLNGQSGDRLLFYGLLFIITVGFITSMVESIFKSISLGRKFKNGETLESKISCRKDQKDKSG